MHDTNVTQPTLYLTYNHKQKVVNAVQRKPYINTIHILHGRSQRVVKQSSQISESVAVLLRYICS